MDRTNVAAWLDRYVAAWKTYDPSAIGDLFSADASYRYNPWEEPVRGREAIVADWLVDPDRPGSWEASYEPLAVDGEVAIASGSTRYWKEDGSLRDEYFNVFQMGFDADGRCCEFAEWYVRRPKPEA